MNAIIDIERGCLDIWIDSLVSCLKDTETGEMKDTVVFKIESRSYLKKFRENNGWHINWSKIPRNVEVYALALHDNNEIQGLIGIRNDNNADAAYIHWACTAPQNNKHEYGRQKYEGVGGHLFAIAADNGINVVRIPKFMEGDTLPHGYNSAPDPYSEPPVSRYNLRAMVNYALEHGKKVTELTKDEVGLFVNT